MRKILLSIIFSFLLAVNSFAGINTNAVTSMILNCGTATDILVVGQPATVMVWANPTTIGATNGRLISKEDSTGAPGITFRMLATATLQFVVSGATALNHASSNNSVTLGTTQNYIWTYDGSVTAANQHTYVNNTETGYQTAVNGITPTDNSASTIEIANRGDLARSFNGKIYEIVIWNRVLTSAERALIYNGGKQGYNMNGLAPKAWWRLNDCPENVNCDTTTFTDLTGNAHTCTASGTVLGAAAQYTNQVGATLRGATY